MATTSSSDESSVAPNFQISTSIDSGGRLSPNKQKCPLCRRFRKTFYCKDCVHGGLFYSSKTKSTEWYIDKQKILLELEDNKRTLEQGCKILIDTKMKCDLLHWKIKQVKDRNKNLKLAIEEKRQKKAHNLMRLEKVKKNNTLSHDHLPMFKQKVEHLCDRVDMRRDKITTIRKNLLQKQEELKIIVRRRIHQLLTFIFPITMVKPSLETESSSSDDMMNALAEASQTIFIKDRWEYTDFMGEMKYCIAGPTLPGSGNYSSYDIWVTHNQDTVPGSNNTSPIERNPAYCISAALTYVAQLVSLLSYFLNIRLPYKMSLSDFCSSSMNEQQFARRVARLNANILYLCFSQNVDLCVLRSSETIHNILQLVESADLGRQGPMEYDPHQANALEQPISENLKMGEDSDSEEGDSFSIEWEAVPHVQCPEIAAGSAIPQSPQMMSTQQASSMAGGLVNNVTASIASIWHSVTGRY